MGRVLLSARLQGLYVRSGALEELKDYENDEANDARSNRRCPDRQVNTVSHQRFVFE